MLAVEFSAWIWFFVFLQRNARGFKTGLQRGDPVFVTDERYRHYRLEDFFWTGSGDGPIIEDSFGNETTTEENPPQDQTWKTTTVFHTTTIVFATVFPKPGDCGSHGCTPHVSPVWTETIDFSSPSPSSTTPEIDPTPTQPLPRTSSPEIVKPPIEAFTATSDVEISELPTSTSPVPPDQRYWLITVLRTEESSELRTSVLEERLASLYQRAFMRRRREEAGQVRVVIYNATGSGRAEARDVGLLYSVSVAGQPVPAISAAADMRLLTLSEVSAELGYPVLTKAERKQFPAYLKGVVPFGARVKGRSRDTWLLIGSVIAAVSLLVVLAALFTLGLSKKRALRSARGAANRRQIYNGEEGTSNLAFETDGPKATKTTESGPTTVTFADQRRGSTSSSSCSGSSEASLVRLRMQQKRREMRRDDGQPKARPRTRVRRVEDANEAIAAQGSARSRETTDDIDDGESREPSPHTNSTPTSYLSMPSVKAFPRKARIPEPLNRVLEPISIRHLDLDDVVDVPVEARNKHVKAATRHGSLEGNDPGVIGPVVWDRHCQQLHGFQKDDNSGGGNVGRMRKRFNELLDDAFTMFESRSGSPEHDGPSLIGVTRLSDNRAKSAVVKSEDVGLFSGGTRPKTTDSKRPQTAVNKNPRGAWNTPHSRTPARPLSAGPMHCPGTTTPVIDANLILVDSELPPSDPAIPLIAAIKEELKKFQRSDSS